MSTIERKALDSVDGFDLTAELLPDYDASPDDADCYSTDDVEAFREGRWEYVGVVVRASRAGIELGSSSIWGVESGQLAKVAADPYYVLNDDYALVADALTEAKANLAALCHQ